MTRMTFNRTLIIHRRFFYESNTTNGSFRLAPSSAYDLTDEKIVWLICRLMKAQAESSHLLCLIYKRTFCEL